MADEVVLSSAGDLTVAAALPNKFLLLLADRNALPAHPAIVAGYAGSVSGRGSAVLKVSHAGLMGYDLLVSGTDVPSVQAGRKLLDTMTQLKMDVSRVHLAVNRSTTRVGLTVRDVEAVLGLQSALEVAEHSSLAAAMNQGSPLTESSPQSPISHAFYDFADQILGLDEPKVRRRLRIGGRA